jgi:hypothetical protein
MFPQGAGQDPSLLVNCKLMDLVLALWAYSSRRQHPPLQPEAQHPNTLGQTSMDTDNSSDPPALNDVNNVISSADKLSSVAVEHQCHSARTSGYKDTLVSVSQDETFGKNITIQTPLIGSLGDHPNVDGTFHGSRVMKGNVCVNQLLSSSFDPSKHSCISCKKEHPVVGKNSTVYFFNDQNFVSNLCCDNGYCINIVRIKNAMLLKLYETAHEIFGNTVFPEGSIFLYSSASYLGRVGTSLNAKAVGRWLHSPRKTGAASGLSTHPSNNH